MPVKIDGQVWACFIRNSLEGQKESDYADERNRFQDRETAAPVLKEASSVVSGACCIGFSCENIPKNFSAFVREILK